MAEVTEFGPDLHPTVAVGLQLRSEDQARGAARRHPDGPDDQSNPRVFALLPGRHPDRANARPLLVRHQASERSRSGRRCIKACGRPA
jgi:hypothetical protein